ncbi:MAG TPA: TonB family protein [Pyrinomonadaceae bacterium]
MRVGAQLLLTFLLNASWQIALVAAFAAVCDWLLRGTAPRFRHGLWVAALFLALALPVLSSASLLKTFLSSKAKPQPAEIAAPVFVTRVSSPDLDSMEPPAAENPASAPAVAPARRNLPASVIHLNKNLATVLIALYGLFLLYRVGQLIRAWRRTKTIVQSAIAFECTGPVAAIIKKCQTAIGVHRVRILCSSSVPVPITVGILSPSIILPERLLHDVDEEVLTTAIGHELVHVSRRDYLANLVYELIYLPLSFHPAVALVRQRIKQTRELCCDEAVATKLLRAETYARSLVRLIGSAPLGRRLAADTTIGISESDILEVRIMTLLKTPKLTARRKRLLLIMASLLLVAPCVAAASFALTFDIDRQEPSVAPQSSEKLERQNQERSREELKRAERELNAQKRVAPKSQLPEIEASLREVQKALAEFDRQRPEAEARLREVQESLELHDRMLQQREEGQKKVEELRTTLAQLGKNQPVDEARMKDVREKIALMEKLYTPEREREVQRTIAEMQKPQTDRKARVIYRVDPEYPQDAREKKIEGTVVLSMTIDHDGIPQNVQVKRSLSPSLDQSAVDAVRKWRFEPAIKNGQPASMFVSFDVYFGAGSGGVDKAQQDLATALHQAVEARSGDWEMKMRKDLEQQGRDERARKQAELTRDATLSMDRAIQIATSQVPGKVLACSLGRDGDKLFYHVVIIGGDGDKTTTTYVWVSAIDGQIIKTEKEDRKEEAAIESAPRAQISGGVLNGKATSLPLPAYPEIARAAHASGEVIVQVTVDETGNVVAARAVSGHQLLLAAAVTAARQARFTPTRLNGEPVKVTGVLVYNFVAP